MGCIYNGQEYSEKELNDFLKEHFKDLTLKITNIDGIAYSIAEKITKTKDDLILLHRNTEKLTESSQSVSEYIDTPHMLGKQEPELLNPVFILENYKNNTLEEWEKKRTRPENLTTEQFREELSQEFDLMIQQTEELAKFSENVLHSLLYARINNNKNQFKGILNNLDKHKEILGESFNSDYLVNLVDDIYTNLNKIYKNGQLMSEIRISGVDKFGQLIKGRIDIIGIDSNGNVNIYDLKMSTNLYEDWDQVKLQKSEYQLGLYRKLLAHNGFNTQKTSLYLIPIQMNYGNGSSITQKAEFINITSNPNMNLVNGKVTRNLQYLIDDKITDNLFNKDAVEEAIIEKLNNVFPKYNFRTQLFNDDADKIIEQSSKRKTEFNKYYFKNEILDKTIYVNSLEELDKEVRAYVNELKDPATKNAKINQFADGLRKNIESQTPPDNILNLKNNPGLVNDIVFNFRQYTDGGWEMIESETLLNAGIIGFKNIHGTLEFVTFTVNKLKDIHLIDQGYNVLGKFMNDSEAEVKKIAPSSVQNIELLKVLIVLNEMPQLFENNRKLGNIKVFNYNTGTVKDLGLEELLPSFQVLTQKLEIPNNFLNNNISILNRDEYLYQLMDVLSQNFDNDKDKKIISLLDSPDFQLRKVERLSEMMQMFIRNHPEYANQDFLTKNKGNKQEDILFNLLSQAILEAKGRKIGGDIINNPELGITGAEFKNFVKAPFAYKDVKINNQGIPTVGLLGGYYFSSPDNMRSDDMKVVTDLIREIHHNMRRYFEEESLIGINRTKEYYQEIGFGAVNQHVIGDSYKHHQNFYRRINETGELDPRFMFKNPYDKNESLTEPERDYLKFMLWNINKKFIKNLSKEDLETNIENVMELPQVLELGEKYFEVPLIKGTNLARAHSTTIGKIMNEFKNQIKSSAHIFDNRNLTPEQLLEIEEQKNNYHTMINPLRLSSNRRIEMLEKWGPSYFETNLDTINLNVAFNYIREKEANKVLPAIHAAITNIKLLGINQKVDLTPQVEFLYKRLKSDLFGETLIHEESKDALKVVNVVKQVQSALAIALRPVLTVKELIGGLVRGFSRALTEVYGENSFKGEHLWDAYKIFLGADNKFTKDINIIDALNNAFGLIDRDINSIVDRQKFDRTGILGGTSKFMYSTAIMADHLNRSVLYIAQMKAEGSWDSISVSPEGKLVYDFSKDKRYDEFYMHKDNPNYSSENFLNQKAAYRIKLNEFIQSGYTNPDGSNLKFGDPLPQVHSPRETNSLKSIINLTYGYFDDEVKPIFGKLWMGILFMNFRNYWSGLKSTWLTKATDKTDQGEFVDKTVNNNGKEEKVFLKEIYDNEGNLIDQIEVLESSPENDGTLEPVKIWKGKIVEGLYWSLAYTFRDFSRFRFKDAYGNKARMSRAKLALNDILTASLGVWLAMVIFRWFREAFGVDMDDEEISLGEHALNMSEMSILKAFGEFDPHKNIFSSLSTEPAIFSTFERIIDSSQKVFFGEGEMLKQAKRNIKMLELIPD